MFNLILLLIMGGGGDLERLEDSFFVIFMAPGPGVQILKLDQYGHLVTNYLILENLFPYFNSMMLLKPYTKIVEFIVPGSGSGVRALGRDQYGHIIKCINL